MKTAYAHNLNPEEKSLSVRISHDFSGDIVTNTNMSLNFSPHKSSVSVFDSIFYQVTEFNLGYEYIEPYTFTIFGRSQAQGKIADAKVGLEVELENSPSARVKKYSSYPHLLKLILIERF